MAHILEKSSSLPQPIKDTSRHWKRRIILLPQSFSGSSAAQCPQYIRTAGSAPYQLIGRIGFAAFRPFCTLFAPGCHPFRNSCVHCLRPLVSPCGSACGSGGRLGVKKAPGGLRHRIPLCRLSLIIDANDLPNKRFCSLLALGQETPNFRHMEKKM